MDEIQLGSRTLRPWRQFYANGLAIPLGRPALEIISILADAKGAVVTKDALLETVWPNTVVEENALQVHISALRKALGPEADRIKTVRGVGYRLDTDARHGPSPEAAEQEDRRPSPPSGPSGILLVGCVVAIVALAAMSYWPFRPASPNPETVWVEPLQPAGGEEARLLALAIPSEIVELLSQAGIQAATVDAGAVPSSIPGDGRIVSGTVTQGDAQVTVRLLLADRDGATLWSKQFEGEAGTVELLADEVSIALARTLYSIRELYLQDGLEVDTPSIALQLRASELVRSAELQREGSPRELMEKFVAQVPQSAHGHGLLAMAWANEARRSAPGARAPFLARSRSEAGKAIDISRTGAGAGYDALYFLQRMDRPREWIAAEDLLLDAVRNAPRFPFLQMRECRLLTDVGRARDALAYCQRALALNPFAEPIGHSYARALDATGDSRQARAVIERFARLNPDHNVSRRVQFELEAFGGDPERALDLLSNPATAPTGLRGTGEDVMIHYLQDAGNWTGARRRQLTKQLLELGKNGDMPLDWAIMALTSMSKRSEALALIESPRFDDLLFTSGSGFLFHPPMAPLRADPRFWSAAARLGLSNYWSARGKWPDVCGVELPMAECKAGTPRAES